MTKETALQTTLCTFLETWMTNPNAFTKIEHHTEKDISEAIKKLFKSYSVILDHKYFHSPQYTDRAYSPITIELDITVLLDSSYRLVFHSFHKPERKHCHLTCSFLYQDAQAQISGHAHMLLTSHLIPVLNASKMHERA